MASFGTAPEDGCSRFGAGNEDAFARLEREYIVEQFEAGMSAEKFVVGPFGSGKTHFLRQLMELAVRRGCVTAEVKLGKEIDFTRPLIVYKEMAREVKAPGQEIPGMQELLVACIEHQRSLGTLAQWLATLARPPFKLREFGTAAHNAVNAYISGKQAERFESACRWLAGEVSDKETARAAGVGKVTSPEQDLTGARLRLSLAQFVRLSGFPGSVFCFDEGDQGFDVDRRKMNKIMSLIRTQVDGVTDLREGSALFVYAVTQPIVEEMERAPMLLDRIRDPGPRQGFFDGNTLAPMIDLTFRPDPGKDLRRIGKRLVDLVYEEALHQTQVSHEDASEAVFRIAEEVGQEDPTASARRMMVKRTCTYLLGVITTGEAQPAGMPVDEEREV
jgi:hypothetical protein